MVVLAVIYIISVWLVAGKLDVRPLNYVLEGVTFGLLINPYFPDNIVFGMRHLLPKLVGATDENFAAEYVFTDLAHERFIDQAGKDPGMIEVFRDEEAIIYRVQFHAEGLN